MTQARLITTPPDGHGITGRMLDRIYAELTSGANQGQQMLVVGIVVPSTTSQRRTAKGVKRFVGFEFLRLEPITDAAIAEECRFALVKAYERRTSTAKQLPLEFEGSSELEKRREIFAAMDEWRGAQDIEVTQGELTEMWREYIQPVEGASVPAMAHAPTADLLRFAYHINALIPEKLAGMSPLPDADEGPKAVRPVPEAMFDDGQGDEADSASSSDGDKPDGDASDPEPEANGAEAEDPAAEQATATGEPSIEDAAAEAAKPAETKGRKRGDLKAV